MADQKFKSKVKLQGGASFPAETAERAPVIDASGNLVSSAVTSTELGYISGLTSSAQTQIGDAQADATQALSDAGAAQADATQALADAADAQADATQALTDASTAQSDINDHIADTADAHAASAITNTPTGNLAATTVQAALNELQDELDSLPDPITYEGTYNATTNSPTLADGTGNTGDLYQVTVAGTQDFGAGNITFAVGDKVVYNGSIWEKWDMTDAVSSVFSRTGAVVAESGDYTASQVTNVPAGTISATTVQAAINELEGDVVAAAGAAADAQVDATQALSDASDAQTAINDHIADTVGAHAASAISNTPTGNLAATDVQAALNELQDDIDALPVGSAGDISETSFSAANNQAAAADVTGLAFAAGTVRGFKALVSIEIDATLDLYETYELIGINKSGSFDMAQSAVGDDSGVLFSITNAGQVQYTSANYSGFVAGAIKFRAITTSF